MTKSDKEMEILEKDRFDIIVLTTGGTIDKSYDEFEGALANRGSHIKHKILSKLRLPYTYLHVFSVLEKDSLHFTDYDRSLLAKTIKVHMEKGFPIVVLHGTDTMAKSAKKVFEDIEKPLVPIVFTGAMKPLGFDDTDATQNVTEALLAAKLLEQGVYVSFHNKIFTVPHVRKNAQSRTFETC